VSVKQKTALVDIYVLLAVWRLSSNLILYVKTDIVISNKPLSLVAGSESRKDEANG